MADRITLKDLNGKLAMLKSRAESVGKDEIGNGGSIARMSIQSGPGGKRIITKSATLSTYEITGFMPARELNLILSGIYLGLEMK
jgi:hypothetical protein